MPEVLENLLVDFASQLEDVLRKTVGKQEVLEKKKAGPIGNLF